MSIRLVNDPKPWASLCHRFVYRLEWRPDRDLPAGCCVELRSHSLRAEDSLRTLEIISEKKVVWRTSGTTRDMDFEVPLGNAERDTHFYLRALQRNGGVIYASPVFVSIRREPGNCEVAIHGACE